MPLPLDTNNQIYYGSSEWTSNPLQVVTASSISAQSAVVSTTTRCVRIAVNLPCWVAIGTNPTASKAAGSAYMPSSCVEYIAVRAGIDKIAVISDAGSAALVSIAELS